MKETQIEGRTLQFEFFTDRWGQKIIIFYKGLESYTERKYLLFGEKITKTRHKEIFRMRCRRPISYKRMVEKIN